MAVQLRDRHPPAAVGGPRQPAGEEGDQPQGQPHLLPVREHGCGGVAAEGDGDPVRAAVRGGRQHQRRPDLLPRPRRLHDRDLQLRQPPCHPARRPRAHLGGLQARRRQAAAAAERRRGDTNFRTGGGGGGGGGAAVRAVGGGPGYPRRRGGAHLVRVNTRKGGVRCAALRADRTHRRLVPCMVSDGDRCFGSELCGGAVAGTMTRHMQAGAVTRHPCRVRLACDCICVECSRDRSV